jgi:ATP-dependent RNA helicase DeaD
MLNAIERATKQPIEQMQLPSVDVVNDVRIGKFKQRISDTLAIGDLGQFQQLIEQYEQEHNVPALEIAAALARIAQGDQPLLLAPPPKREKYEPAPREHGIRPARGHDAHERPSHDRNERRAPGRDSAPRHEHAPHEHRPHDSAPREFAGARPVRAHATEAGKRTYRVEVGHDHGVKPGNIIGAIANEAGLESQHIGRLSIRGEYSLIDLPDNMPKEVFEHLKKVWVVQQQLRINEWDGNDAGAGSVPPPRGKPGGHKPGGFKPRPGGAKPPRRK